MKKFKLIFLFTVLSLTSNAQKIEIVDVEKYGTDYNGYLLIKCQLINNTDKDIVLPKQIDKYYNYFSFFYRINTYPKNVFSYIEHPPLPVVMVYPRLTKEDLLVCSKNSKIEFELDTRKIGDMGLRIIDNIGIKNFIKLKKIRILYTPTIIKNQEKFLEDEIKDIRFYDKKIESKYYVLSK